MNAQTKYIEMLRCEKCQATFGDNLEKCPECGSGELSKYQMENPMSRLPIHRLLSVAGHLAWMIGVGICIALIWHTNTPDTSQNLTMLLAAFGSLLLSLIVSVTLFGMGELLKRVIRIQRRLRAFVDVYETEHNGSD